MGEEQCIIKQLEREHFDFTGKTFIPRNYAYPIGVLKAGWFTQIYSAVRSQLCLTLCNPVDCSPPGYSAHGILQARILERVPFPPPGIFPTHRSSPCLLCLLHWQADSLLLVPPGKPSYIHGAFKNRRK